MTLLLLSEHQLSLFEDEGDGFLEALQSVVNDVVEVSPDTNGEAVAMLVARKRMSWRTFHEETVEFVVRSDFVAEFGAIDGMTDVDWGQIYDAILRLQQDHQNGDVMLRLYLYRVHRLFYKKWLFQCYV